MSYFNHHVVYIKKVDVINKHRPGDGGTCLQSQYSIVRGRWNSVSSRLAWTQERVLGQAAKLHRECCLKKNTQKQNTKKETQQTNKQILTENPTVQVIKQSIPLLVYRPDTNGL